MAKLQTFYLLLLRYIRHGLGKMHDPILVRRKLPLVGIALYIGPRMGTLQNVIRWYNVVRLGNDNMQKCRCFSIALYIRPRICKLQNATGCCSVR